MANTLFDTFTRGLSRQLPTSTPIASENRSRRKKQNKNNGGQKKVFSRCNSQISDCEAFAQDGCNDAACLAAVTVCCQLLGACNFTGFIACVNEATAV